MRETLTRYEIKHTKYPHSGIICGGLEYMITHKDDMYPYSNTDYLRFIGLIDNLGYDKPTGIPVPNWAELNLLSIKKSY